MKDAFKRLAEGHGVEGRERRRWLQRQRFTMERWAGQGPVWGRVGGGKFEGTVESSMIDLAILGGQMCECRRYLAGCWDLMLRWRIGVAEIIDQKLGRRNIR